jgi:hypothetical protein
MTEVRTSLVTGVEVRTSESTMYASQMPVRLEERDGLTALVFYTPGEETVVTILLTGADRIALIELMGGTR